MHDIFSKLAEAKIKEAIENGQLKNLPGQGKPLILEPINPFEDPEDRMFNKIMKNLDLIPQEIDLKREMDNLRQKIEESTNDEEIDLLKKKLQEMSITYNVLMEKRRRK